MNSNDVKRTLEAGGVAVGTMVFEFGTTGIAKAVAAAGADFIMFDTEHSGWTSETLRVLLASTGGTKVVPLVRVPTLDYHAVAQALDLGAMGVMAPNIQSTEQAKALVEFARYPPRGRRGASFGLARDDYREILRLEETMDRANRETLLIAQVESTEGIAELDRIAGVDGIDVVWLGQFDLTLSLGAPGDFEGEAYRRSVEKLLCACLHHGKAAGVMATSVDEGRAAVRKGFRCIAYSNDIRIYRSAVAEGVGAIRREAPPPSA